MARLVDLCALSLAELLDLLAPPCCARCRRSLPRGRSLCPGCDARIARLPADRCALCQERGAGASGVCTPCAHARSPLSHCLAAATFEGEAADWIRRLKYGRGLAALDAGPESVARALVREAAARLPDPRPDVVVPVPIHVRRLRRRGLHVAGILAREAARTLGAQHHGALLRRTRDTPSQTGLGTAARRRNVAGAFLASPAARGARVCLVDDVVTTGATLGEAARALRAAGASQVAAVCAARTARLEAPGVKG